MSNLKPMVALYKTYRGGEWFESSLESVYRHCVGIVAVMSDLPWRGVAGGNFLPENCRGPLSRFQSRHPDVRVLVVAQSGRSSTDEQYRVGLSLISSTFGKNCGVLIVDTDEVWEDGDLACLRETMTSNPRVMYFRSGIRTYLRSPMYRVTPQEQARVVVGLARPSLSTGNSRFSNLHGLVGAEGIMDVDCNFHHYGYVRLDSEEIISKLACSISQDGVPCVDNWKRSVWDRLPEGRDIHPQVGFAKCWGGVEEVGLSRHPWVVLESDAFWAGMLYHQVRRLPTLLTSDNTDWRHRVECMSHGDCPATTVSNSCSAAMAHFSREAIGRDLDQNFWAFLMSRLRMSLRETAQLVIHALAVPSGGSVLEIGSGLGGSMATLMLACHGDVTLTAVDPYLPYNEENVVLDVGVREGSADTFSETIGRTAEATKRSLPRLVQKSSSEASTELSTATFDLVLVDGNHSYAYCKEDLSLWWPKVKVGGCLLVHDYASRFPGVVRAVGESGLQFKLPMMSTLAWVRKE